MLFWPWRQFSFIIGDPDFADQMIIDEDKYIFESFMKGIKSRRQGLAVFRIKLYDELSDGLRWQATGYLQSNHYIGYIMDITETARFIRSTQYSNDSIVKKINIFNNPVLLVEFDSKKIFLTTARLLMRSDILRSGRSERFEDILKMIFCCISMQYMRR